MPGAPRGKRLVALYDGYRVDHLVGRTAPLAARMAIRFSPGEEPAQVAQGEAILRLLIGTTRRSSRRISRRAAVRPPVAGPARYPGCKVLRWERDWTRPISRHESGDVSRAVRRGDRDARYRNPGRGGPAKAARPDQPHCDAYSRPAMARSGRAFRRPGRSLTDRINTLATIGDHN
jgi:hypothetical protein